MDLRKNVPVVPGQNENSPTPDKESKKAFLQLIGGLVTVMFLFFYFGTNTSKTNPNNQPQQKVAEANVQSTQPQQQIPDVNSQSNKPQSKPVAQPQSKPTAQPQPKPTAQPQHKPAAQPQPKPVAQPQPKPVAQPQPKPVAQPKPPTPRPSNVASSAGKNNTLLKKAWNIGKAGLFLITRGKVRIR